MKKCIVCSKEKNKNEFYSGKYYRDGYCNSCKECKKRYQLKHRKTNPFPKWKQDLYLEKIKERTKRLRAIVLKAKNKPCTDCKTSFPYMCMDFDHVKGEKEFNIGHYSHYGEKRLIDEIAKCEVVCSNCHRVRTFKKEQHLSNMPKREVRLLG